MINFCAVESVRSSLHEETKLNDYTALVLIINKYFINIEGLQLNIIHIV